MNYTTASGQNSKRLSAAEDNPKPVKYSASFGEALYLYLVWTELLQQILPSIYTFSNLVIGRVYLVVDDDGLTLIDTGTAFATNRIFRDIAKSEFKIDDLKRIVITHAHPDHASQIPRLKAKSGASVYASELERIMIEGNEPMESIRGAPRWWPKLLLPESKLEHGLREGDVVPFFGGMTAIATPGHTRGHMAFWQEQKRILFCGDVLIRIPRTRLPFSLVTQDIQENVRSLKKLSRLKPAAVLPGHGRPILDNAAQHLEDFTRKQTRKFGIGS